MTTPAPAPHATRLRTLAATCAAWLLCCIVAGAAAQPAGAGAGEIVITQALMVASDEDRFPAGAPATSVTLPDEWDGARLRHAGSVWYRVGFDLPSDTTRDQLFTLAIERACSSLEVHLNGNPIQRGGRMHEPLTRDCLYPQRITLPAAWLQPRGNLLELRVAGLPLPQVASRQRAGGLSAIVIGPQDQLAPRHAERLFWNVTAVQIASGALGVLGALFVGLWRLHRREAQLLYFGLALVLWALLSARGWWREPPLDSSTLEFLVAPAFAVATGLAVQFLLSYAGLRSRAIEGALVVQALIVPASLWLAGPNRRFEMVGAWGLLLALQFAAAAGLYLRESWRRRPRDVWPMAGVLAAGLLVMVMELAVQRRLLAAPPVPPLSLALALLMLGVALRLLYTYAVALRRAEAERAGLEGRIQEITNDIERNYAQLADQRVEQVTEKERKRIAADLHDDLGAKLLTIVHTSESERISTLAREALEEMRLSVRGLTGKPMRLADALADWRAETVLRLGQANIEIDWRGPAEDTDLELPARSYVQTTRILRESVSNIIKHSGASHCKVRCAIGDQQFGLNVQDNGRGIPMELDGKLDRGHGMSSMKHRAKQMHGQCLVESGPGYGTVIRLTLPL